jgi:hypothetical protein
MGKVFVKGPVESPDDLLSKESQLGRAGRVLADAGEGALNFTKPVDNFADFAGKPLNVLRYFMEGRHKRKLSPEEEAIQRARLNQIGQDQIREEMQPAMDARAALAAKEKEQAAALAAKEKEQADFDYLQSVDPRVGQRNYMDSVYGNRSIGDAAKLERRSQDNYAAQQRLEALRTEPKYERGAAKQTADELAAQNEAESLPRYDFNEVVHPGASDAPEALNLDKEVIGQEAAKINAQLQPNMDGIAAQVNADGGVKSSEHDADDEATRDNEFGAGDAQNDAAATPTNAAVMAMNDKKEEPDFRQVVTGGATQVPMQVASQGPFGVTAPPLSQASNNSEEPDDNWWRKQDML